jgi:hypothetical protein
MDEESGQNFCLTAESDAEERWLRSAHLETRDVDRLANPPGFVI